MGGLNRYEITVEEFIGILGDRVYYFAIHVKHI